MECAVVGCGRKKGTTVGTHCIAPFCEARTAFSSRKKKDVQQGPLVFFPIVYCPLTIHKDVRMFQGVLFFNAARGSLEKTLLSMKRELSKGHLEVII